LGKARLEHEHRAMNACEATMSSGREAKMVAQLRHGFLGQLVHRGKQLLRQRFSSRQG
jgi:hypothetical protein